MVSVGDKVNVLFRCGMNYNEILQMLEVEGVCMSMRTLKRLLKHQKLYRRAHYSDVVDVALFLLKELLTSNQLHGYKLMHLKCLHEGFIVTQETAFDSYCILSMPIESICVDDTVCNEEYISAWVPTICGIWILTTN